MNIDNELSMTNDVSFLTKDEYLQIKENLNLNEISEKIEDFEGFFTDPALNVNKKVNLSFSIANENLQQLIAAKNTIETLIIRAQTKMNKLPKVSDIDEKISELQVAVTELEKNVQANSSNKPLKVIFYKAKEELDELIFTKNINESESQKTLSDFQKSLAEEKQKLIELGKLKRK